MKRIYLIVLTLIFIMLFAACGTKKDDVDVTQKSGVMCSVKESNWGEYDNREEILLSTEYIVEYDRTVRIVKNYNLAGKCESTSELSEEDFNTLYNIVSKMKFKDTSSEGCDGTGWRITFEDEVKFSGYLGDGKEKTVVEIIRKY